LKTARQSALTGNVAFDGQVIVGGSVSLTVTVNEQRGAPEAEEHVTGVVPTGKNEPEAGVHLTVPQSPVGGG
jgi:hypothetical protein